MVRGKGGGGGGEKEGRGEEVASSEGGGRYWWAVRPMQVLGSTPSPFMVVGVGVALLLSSVVNMVCTHF